MKIDGTPYRSVWVDGADGWSVRIFDQTKLPWSLDILRLTAVDQVAHAIRSMQVRGAPLIGAVAAYGLALALRADASTDAMERDAAMLNATRPTAVNLRWALERMLTRLRNTTVADRAAAAYDEARPHLRRGRGPERADWRTRPAADPCGRRRGRPQARQRAHPLQRRLDRHRGLGNGPGADLQGA